MPETYCDPVAQLLTLGDPRQKGGSASEEWRDYPALGLTPEQIPELARMALDEKLHLADPESPEVWAPLHAWRALGQLGAESAVEPLLELLDRIDDDEGDDWVQGDLPKVFGMIGPAAILRLRDFLADTENGPCARAAAGDGLVRIVERFPETREQAVAIITNQLRLLAEQERFVNACLVGALCGLKAVESSAVMEQAFAADVVDLTVLGDWEEAQILLGLLEERVTPEPDFLELEFGLQLPLGELRIVKPTPHRASKEKKAKRKQAKAARRRNRRR